MKVYEDYVMTTKLNLDLVKMKDSCYKMYDLIENNFNVPTNYRKNVGYSDTSGKSPLTTNLFDNYNILFYPYPEFHELYKSIQSFFRECCIDDEKYYAQCWVNIYKQGDYIDWHSHWPVEMNSWHGFFCVDCEPSKTTYRIPNRYPPVDIESEDNLLVLSRSNGDTHRTWPWEESARDRITIAFDIIPRQHIQPGSLLNHWLPI